MTRRVQSDEKKLVLCMWRSTVLVPLFKGLLWNIFGLQLEGFFRCTGSCVCRGPLTGLSENALDLLRWMPAAQTSSPRSQF